MEDHKLCVYWSLTATASPTVPFYGIKLLTTKDGRYTNAIFGFLNILLSLLKESEPDEVAVAFRPQSPHLPPQDVRRLQGHPP